ncbi:MAG TPA: MerR family transcriptional regulator [Candidatus Limnocylindria bacterium]|nr:MerR family transcriptional regulator [Candidatus Limnocylindria bacterium]
MLISEFARATGLSRDTIRFYVKRGLLKPTRGSAQSNRYHHFNDEQVQRAAFIRTAQFLGFTLAEIDALALEVANGFTRQGKIALMNERIARIDDKIATLREIRRAFVRKRSWLEGGERGEDPFTRLSG